MLTQSEKKARLLSLIIKDGILYRTPTQPVLSRDGTSGRWMLDSLCVSLTYEGIQLAASCLLELLSKFEGRQLATLGTTAIPLLTACVMQSNVHYTGLLVRKERKPHGSRKLIEGKGNRLEPVILLDDSISSGISMQQCRDILEAEGYRVEGGICLVRFDWYGGFALMQEQGYHMETVFDVDRDIVYHMESEAKPMLNPTKQFPAYLPWHKQTAPEHLTPMALARTVLKEYLVSGLLLRPPEQLDNTYFHQGGCFISMRQRDNIYNRPARDGFWHFPGERIFSAAEDVVLASYQTARHLPKGEEGLAILNNCGLAITFFSALEACQLGDLDNERYGIVVRSNERPTKMGGALPRMPGIAHAGEQFHHAYINNAELVSFEPYTLYRHEVYKYVEPDIQWQESGVAKNTYSPQWYESTVIAQLITQRARDYLYAELTQTRVQGKTLTNNLCPELDSLYLSISLKGKLLGCMGKIIGDLEQDIQLLTQAVLQDQRFSHELTANDIADLNIKIALLHAPLELGPYEPQEVMGPVRFGEQALLAHQGELEGILLPDVAVQFNYSEQEYAQEVLAKAGITQPPYAWRRYDCHTWLDDGQHIRLLVKGFPQQSAAERDIPTRLPELMHKWATYIQRQQQDNGTFYFYYYPFQHQIFQTQDHSRTAHTLWVLLRYQQRYPEQVDSAKLSLTLDYLQAFIQHHQGKTWLSDAHYESELLYDSVTGSALLLMALSQLPHLSAPLIDLAAQLAATLWQTIDHHGKIHSLIYPTEHLSDEVNQDYVPGQVLLALALAYQQGLTTADPVKLDKALGYYWHRFQYKRRVDQVSWLTQAWVAWWNIQPSQQWAQRIYASCDWILTYQSKLDGGFTTWQQAGRPDYMTAVYLEAVAAGLSVAMHNGDTQRANIYQQACLKAFAFLDALTIQERDKSVLPELAWAVGGLRQSTTNSVVRVDFNQHALSAALYYVQADKD